MWPIGCGLRRSNCKGGGRGLLSFVPCLSRLDHSSLSRQRMLRRLIGKMVQRRGSRNADERER